MIASPASTAFRGPRRRPQGGCGLPKGTRTLPRPPRSRAAPRRHPETVYPSPSAGRNGPCAAPRLAISSAVASRSPSSSIACHDMQWITRRSLFSDHAPHRATESIRGISRRCRSNSTTHRSVRVTSLGTHGDADLWARETKRLHAASDGRANRSLNAVCCCIEIVVLPNHDKGPSCLGESSLVAFISFDVAL